MIDHALDINDPKDMGLVDPNGTTLSFAPPTVYDIDWEMNSAKTVKLLHSMNKKVICYVDVGAFETYRADAQTFPKSVRGKPDSHWEGSYWLDIRRLDVLIPIMRARFQVCKDKGFDAIEPDEVDGYANNSGFKLSYHDQLTYNRAIAELAHSLGMSVGLKGDIEQVRDLWTHFDWTLNEQCFEFAECDALSKYFIANGKAVFHVEYDDPFSGHRVQTREFCGRANTANFNSMKMPLDLSGGRWPCR
jgi:endo-alpha-1,4-polygalactosaminidase (GH114 family)